MYIQLLVITLLLVVYWVKKRLSYWRHRGVKCLDATFPYGNLRGLGKEAHAYKITQRAYQQLKGNGLFGGVHFFLNPVALITHLDLVKSILVKDFAFFHDRTAYHNERDDPLSAHLFSMEGSKWKNLRAKLTPTFTSGKMKMMFPTINNVAEEFRDCIIRETRNTQEVEMKELLSRFTTDVIGTCAFGLECNSLQDPDAEFRRMGRKVFEPSRYKIVKRAFLGQFQKLARALRLTFFPKDVTSFFMTVVKDTIRFREQHHIQRNDFMSLLIKLMNGESVEDGSTNTSEKLTVEEVAAQAFVFFLAGFETSSTMMSFCMYELALNQSLQDKARQNVQQVLKTHGSMSYEAVHEMKYVQMCLNESLRKYPPGTVLTRVTSKHYSVPEMRQVIEKGTTVCIPVYAIHHDPEYYPDPEKYNPERFSDEETAKRNPYAFLPFGEGPRICIGLRFGMMQACIGMAHLLNSFRFTLSPQMPVPMKISTEAIILAIDGGLMINVERI